MTSQAKCKFCNGLVDPLEMDWGAAYDMVTDESYVYHKDCLVIDEN